MSLLYYLIVGLIAGWLAGKIMKGSGYGLLGDLVIGILGAMIGGSVLGLVGIVTYGLIGNILSALVGAIILIFIVRLIRKA
jgi:uncharacterized membrane protein YeaQ/YmgE (transglycosylase-associated protein family)